MRKWTYGRFQMQRWQTMKAPPLSFLKWTCSKQIVIVRFAANNVPQFVAFSGRNLSATPGEDNNFSRRIKNFSNWGAERGGEGVLEITHSCQINCLRLKKEFWISSISTLSRICAFYSENSILPNQKRALWSIALGCICALLAKFNSHLSTISEQTENICQQHLSKQEIFLNNILWEKRNYKQKIFWRSSVNCLY